MNIDKNTVKATFLRRPNRFQGFVNLNGVELMAHVPNTGRCKEILKEETTVILREEKNNPNRKTAYSLIAAYKGIRLINIDSQMPNKVVEEALNNKIIEELKDYNYVSREKTYGNSRFDFKLAKSEEGLNIPKEEYYLEVKGVTLEENGETRFPDAPTERGTKHILELIEVKNSGIGAGIIFVIQLDDVKSFRPNDEMDPKFGKALRKASESGVDIMAYCCKVKEDSMTLYKRIPVEL